MYIHVCVHIMYHSTHRSFVKLVILHSFQSSSNGCGEIPASTGPVPIPSYCYVLVPSMGTVPTPSLEEDVLFPILAENTLSSVSPASDHDWGVTRCNICARVIHYQPEVRIMEHDCTCIKFCVYAYSMPVVQYVHVYSCM